MATDATTNQATNDNSTDQTQNSKPTFTPEQQEVFNNALREAQGRAGREHKERADRLQRELDELKSRQNEKTETTGNTANTSDKEPDWKVENKRIREEYDNKVELANQKALAEARRREDLEKTMRERDRQDAIREAMDSQEFEFVNRKAVIGLSHSNVVWDEDRSRFVVHDDKGRLRFNSSLEPMTLEEYYQAFSTEHPYLVKAKTVGGAGSSESKSGAGKYRLEELFGPKSNGALVNKLAIEDPGLYRRLRSLAKEQGLVL